MEVVNNRHESRFEVALPGGDMAFADYVLTPGKVTFPHTVVPAAHEGRGIASAIAKASLDWARAEGLMVVPQCSFYAAYMKSNRETHDLVDDSASRALGIA